MSGSAALPRQEGRPPLPPCPPSYSVSLGNQSVMKHKTQAVSSRRQTVSTRPPRPPSYEEATSPEPAAEPDPIVAPPPSEAGPSTSSPEVSSLRVVQEEEEEEEYDDSHLDFPKHYWTSQPDPFILPKSPTSLSLVATCGAASDHSIRIDKPPLPWKTFLSYGTYFCLILWLLAVYTVFLLLVSRSLNVLTIIMVCLLYLGVGFLIWVCYLVLKGLLQRLWRRKTLE